jgi:hypothetical protein
MMYEGMLIECSGSVRKREKNMRTISLIRLHSQQLFLCLYSRMACELPTPGSDLVMTLGCEYMLVATEMLLLRVDSVDIVSGLRRRDSSLSLPLISRKSVDISPSERQPSVIRAI